ncbi:acyltransferase [uncultured Algimonas sp.]|uniref:acyltransferase family protein n=1 Tax=uncultured Algimonas sp. TaxID=1547920 RepID=UPI0026096DCF|nr:acyltransferase [uncultured Algimonas sp.]
MSIATPSRLDHVQALRGLAAMLVLLAHLALIERRSLADPFLPVSMEWGMMGVDLFFVISGFIMVFVTRDWRGGGGGVPEFLFARATRIYPLYWVVTAALLLVWVVRPDLVFSSSPNDPQWLNTLLLVPSAAYPLLEVGWTLVYEMMFYVLFALILFLPAKVRPAGLAVWAAAVIVGHVGGWQAAGALAFHLFSPLTLEFLAGTAVALIYLRMRGNRTVAFALVLAGLAGLAVWFFIGGAFQDQGARVLRLTLPACALLLGAAWLDRHGATAPAFAVRLGDWSYSLYLTHLLSLVLVEKLWGLAGLEGLPAPVFLIVAVGTALVIAALTYRLIEKPLIDRARGARKRLFP